MTSEKIIEEYLPKMNGWCTPQKAAALVRYIRQEKPKVVVEIGVFAGRSFIPMANALSEIGKGFAWGIDPYSKQEGTSHYDEANAKWWGSLNYDEIYQEALGYLIQFKLTEYATLLRMTSESAANLINEVSFLHVDGCHAEEQALKDVHLWLPKVKPSGIVCFDDTNWPMTQKAQNVLNDQCEFLEKIAVDGNECGFWRKRKP